MERLEKKSKRNAKKISGLFLVALLGGISAFGINWLIEPKQKAFESETTNMPVYQTSNFPASTTVLPDFSTAAEKTVNAVVHVKTTYEAQQLQQPSIQQFFFGNPFGDQFGQRMPTMASGSGVIISNDGYIITNNHVVENAKDIEIVLNDNRKYTAKLIGRDPATDIALIKIDEKNLPTIPYGNSDKLKIGEWVLAVGNPFNLTSTVTAGIVSAKARNINLLRQKQQYAIESFIQTDAAVNPGNSGGALVNTNGELVGINTAIASQTGSYAGYSFAVPVTIVKKVVADLKEFGTVQRALLGVNIQDVDAKLAEDLKMDKPEGVYVVNVNKESAAEEAGIKEKDVIVKVNDTPVEKVSELQEQISRFSPGDKVTVWVKRDGKLKKFLVELKNSLGTTEVVNKDIIQVLGASFASISNETKDKLKIKNGVQVTDLQAGKLMKAGVRPGFVITHVNRKSVNSPKDIQNLLKDLHGGVYIQGVYPDGEIAYYAFGLE
ncbi:MAG: Do family serine endopeptidase [Bacteroidales bacterium]|nr:Do family serine endopeptidase [Bacteroidales bacterium]